MSYTQINTNLIQNTNSAGVVASGANVVPEIVRVENFAALPDPTTTPNEFRYVLNKTGILFTRKESGYYYSDGSEWVASGDNIRELNEVIYDNSSSGLLAVTAQTAVDEIKNVYIPDSVIVVKQPSDLTNIDSTKLYLIDGIIDMGTQQIEVPASGFFFKGHDYFISKLFSSEDNYTMFINKTGEVAGNIQGSHTSFYLTGSGSKILDLDNNESNAACEFISCNFGDFSTGSTKVGDLTGYRQFKLTNCAFIRISDGLTFNGNFAGGFSITETIMLAIPANVTCFKEGTSLVFQGSSTSGINAIDIDATTIVFDFQDSNFALDRGFNLVGARFNLASNPVPNLPEDSTKRFFKDCTGVTNTFIGGRWTMTGQATTALTLNVPAKLNGTVTYDNLVHFSGDNSNEFVYESAVNTDIIVTAYITIDGGPNDQIDLIVRKYDSEAAAYVDMDTYSRQISNVLGGLDVTSFNINSVISMKVNDRVEIWMRNNSDGTNATALNGSYLRVNQR